MGEVRYTHDASRVNLYGEISPTLITPIAATPQGALAVEIAGPSSAFGEVSVAERTQTVALDFIYGINSEVANSITQGSGTVAATGNVAYATTAAAGSSLASLRTKRILKYKDGLGATARFTGIWNAAAIADPAGATTTIGVGTAESFLGFGYVGGAGFSIIHNESAVREVQTLTINTASSNNQTAVITLAGVAYNVSVTNSGVAAQTAYEIATGVNYNATFPGWTASSSGSTVVFVCSVGGDQTGTFSASFPTSGSGTFAETVAGATGTTTIIPQSTWNKDRFDGSSGANNPSGQTLHPEYLTPYQIRYQYLGGGNIDFEIESKETGKFVLVHQIKRAGTSDVTSLRNPGGPLQVSARNTTNTTAVAVGTASMAGFVDGKRIQLGVERAYSGQKAAIGTTATPLFSIRAAQVFNNKVSTVEILPHDFRVANLTTNRAVIIDVYENPTLTAYENFSAISATTSVARIGTTATGISGGILKASMVVQGGSQSMIDFNGSSVGKFISPGAWWTFAARADSSTVEVAYSFSWQEEQ